MDMTERFNQPEITLPPGCLLRQANSSDWLEFKQLPRLYLLVVAINWLVFIVV